MNTSAHEIWLTDDPPVGNDKQAGYAELTGDTLPPNDLAPAGGAPDIMNIASNDIDTSTGTPAGEAPDTMNIASKDNDTSTGTPAGDVADR